MVCSRLYGVFLLLAAACLVRPAFAQEQGAGKSQPDAVQAASSSSRKKSHAQDFLIKGTVFTDKALAFPGVQLRIRRTAEKKFRWQTYSNSRGEFAARVPQGSEYELVAHAKGFMDQTRTIDAKNGDYQDGIAFRMQPSGGKK